MKQYSHKRKNKVGTIIGIIVLIMLLGASISILGMATKGFKSKPSWKNLQKPKIEKEKEKPKEKIEYDKNLDVQKELKKVNNKASMNMALFDLRKTGTDVLSINHDYIRTVRDYGEKESEAYKQLSKLTSEFAEDKIDKVQIDHNEVTFGYMLKRETYKDNSKWQDMIDDISKQTSEEVIEEIFAGKKIKLRMRGVKSEENDGVGLLVTVSSKDLKEVFDNNYLNLFQAVVNYISASAFAGEYDRGKVDRWLMSQAHEAEELYKKTEFGYTAAKGTDPFIEDDSIAEFDLMFVRAGLKCEDKKMDPVDMFYSVIRE